MLDFSEKKSYMIGVQGGEMLYSVHRSENSLFAIKVIATVVVVFFMLLFLSSGLDAFVGTVITYVVLILLYLWFYKIYLVAHMKGNGICVSQKQFPDIFELYCNMARDLNIKNIPPLFILQNGGLLNAFAIRLSGKNYIAIYSDIFALYKVDIGAVKFVLAHELGHVQRKHNQKRFWTLPSLVVPFLDSAYSRACEYTCDNIGAAFISDESCKAQGLLLLAGGSGIYKEVDINDYLYMAAQHKTLAVEFMNLFISHPYLPDRIKNLQKLI